MIYSCCKECDPDPVTTGSALNVQAGHPPCRIIVVEQATDGAVAHYAGKRSPRHDTRPSDRTVIVVGQQTYRDRRLVDFAAKSVLISCLIVITKPLAPARVRFRPATAESTYYISPATRFGRFNSGAHHCNLPSRHQRWSPWASGVPEASSSSSSSAGDTSKMHTGRSIARLHARFDEGKGPERRELHASYRPLIGRSGNRSRQAAE
jgi:hypothetical protein